MSLFTVPAPLSTLLLSLAPSISLLRYSLQIISWQSSSLDSYLAISLLFFARPLLRYALPLLLLLPPLLPHRPSSPPTEHTLSTVISDLSIINDLLPSIPSIPHLSLRLILILSLPYLLLTHFFSLSRLLTLLLIALLCHRAPWAIPIRAALSRSAFLRWSAYHTWSLISGTPLPPSTLSLQPPSSTALVPTNESRVLFIIHENQRWWVTLDWTPALLPSERPAWSASAAPNAHAVSPPSAFSLPDPSSVVLTDPLGRTVQRTATWRWHESEWSVLVKKQGDEVDRVEKPDPSLATTTTPTSRPTLDVPVFEMRETDHDHLDHAPDPTPDEPTTDSDGWVYFDNKWEHPSSVNGRNKFTRYRRWSRLAIISEVVEPVEPPSASITSIDIPSTDRDTSIAAAGNLSPIPTSGDFSPKRATLRQRMQDSLRKTASP